MAGEKASAAVIGVMGVLAEEEDAILMFSGGFIADEAGEIREDGSIILGFNMFECCCIMANEVSTC